MDRTYRCVIVVAVSSILLLVVANRSASFYPFSALSSLATFPLRSATRIQCRELGDHYSVTKPGYVYHLRCDDAMDCNKLVNDRDKQADPCSV